MEKRKVANPSVPTVNSRLTFNRMARSEHLLDSGATTGCGQETIGSGSLEDRLVTNVLGFERVGIHERKRRHILVHAGVKVTKKEFFFLLEQSYRFVDNKSHSGFGFRNKPTVCAPRSGSESGTTTYCVT